MSNYTLSNDGLDSVSFESTSNGYVLMWSKKTDGIIPGMTQHKEYTLDKTNSNSLDEALKDKPFSRCTDEKEAKELIIAVFGRNLDTNKFELFCTENDIHFLCRRYYEICDSKSEEKEKIESDRSEGNYVSIDRVKIAQYTELDNALIRSDLMTFDRDANRSLWNKALDAAAEYCDDSFLCSISDVSFDNRNRIIIITVKSDIDIFWISFRQYVKVFASIVRDFFGEKYRVSFTNTYSMNFDFQYRCSNGMHRLKWLVCGIYQYPKTDYCKEVYISNEYWEKVKSLLVYEGVDTTQWENDTLNVVDVIKEHFSENAYQDIFENWCMINNVCIGIKTSYEIGKEYICF